MVHNVRTTLSHALGGHQLGKRGTRLVLFLTGLMKNYLPGYSGVKSLRDLILHYSAVALCQPISVEKLHVISKTRIVIHIGCLCCWQGIAIMERGN